MKDVVLASDMTSDQIGMMDAIVAFLKDSGRRELRLGGVAGCGKTTVAALIPEFAAKAGLRPSIAYCAFTGKAASVMRTKGMKATTIHSLIYHASVRLNEEAQRMEYDFGLKAKGELDCDMIVVDEASTVSQQLYRDLMSMGRKVIFVGDYGQLPPIGDDVNLMAEETLDFRLSKIHRQAERSDVIRLSMAVRNGDQVAFHHGVETAKVHLSEVTTGDLLHYGQVLCGYNSTRTWLNSEMRREYGFTDPFPQRKEKMVFLRNSRKTETFNGEQFVVLDCRRAGDDFIMDFVSIDSPDSGRRTVRVLGRSVDAQAGQESVPVTKKDLSRGEVQMATYAYAMSVHKAQGSQWQSVALYDPCSSFSGDPDFRRRFLYTAITRASDKFLWIVR